MILLTFSMIGCGGSSNSNHATTPGGAQGIYIGTTQNGSTFEAIITSDDKFYALHGTTNGNAYVVDGMMAGQGASSNGKYTATGADYTSTPVPGTLSATYVAGQSITGNVTGGGTTIPFSGTAVTSFNWNTAATLADVQGSWSGTILSGVEAATSVTVAADGSFTGNDGVGCSFTGNLKPDTAGKNYYTATVTLGAAPCDAPGATLTGAGVYYPAGTGHQLAVAVYNTQLGTAFVGNR
jgi:hypothetical protein